MDAFSCDLIRSGIISFLSIAIVQSGKRVYTFCEGHEVPNDPARED